MNTEEKAKAYDGALKQAKKELNTCGSLDCDAARQIFRFFPQLRESEDERIRMTLCDMVRDMPYMEAELRAHGLTAEKTISYLEKQKEHHIPWYDYQKSKEAGYTIVPNEKYEQLIKQKEQNPAWSEKDKKVYSRLLNHYKSLTHCVTTADRHKKIGEELNFLKSLRPQPKQEWSEEDTLMLTVIIQTLERFGGRGTTGMQIAWLESLRNRVGKESLQPHWKPSEHQMKALEQAKISAVAGNYITKDSLCSLYEQLKKLV